MASIIRFRAMRALKSDLVRSTMGTLRLSMSTPIIRCINTSSKPPQASSASATTTRPLTEARSDDTADKSEDWVSWGMCETDKWWDRFSLHLTCFTSISLCLVLGGTIFAYLPDPRYYEWGQREAYLQLRYREDHGLPPIDRNLIDPAKIILPTDEELGDTEIII